MSTWVQMKDLNSIVSVSAPWLLASNAIAEASSFATREGATWKVLDLSTATSTSDVIGQLKKLLPFPEWCGSNWDAVFDAYKEIASTWPFPLLLGVEGLAATLETNLHLALTTVIRLDELRGALSREALQLEILYLLEPPASDPNKLPRRSEI